MRGINCSCCLSEMSWSNLRSQWECGCGKATVVILVATQPAERGEDHAQQASETHAVFSSGPLPRSDLLARPRVVHIRQLTH